jgi:competence protein ComEC
MTSVPFSFRSGSFFLLPHSLLLLLTTVYLSGEICAAWGWSFISPWWIGSGILFTGAIWWKQGRRVAVVVGCLLVTFSFAHATLWKVLQPQFPPHHLRNLPLPQQVTIDGWLFREPEHAPHRGRLYVEALHVWKDGTPHPAVGKILLTVRTLSSSWHYGDVLRLTCNLRQPRNFRTPGSFDYEGYLARQGIFLSAFLWDDTIIERIGTAGTGLWRFTERVRNTIGAFFVMHLDTETAAILQALIIGDERYITKDLREAFSRAGVAHVLSISGLHISLVATTAYAFWWWVVSRSPFLLLTFPAPILASLLAVPPVLLYAAISGGSVATWRSVLMVVTYLLAIVLGRQSEVYRSLALAALLISFVWPGAVLDVSFQLSFLSVLSLFLGVERFALWWSHIRHRLHLDTFPHRERLLRWGATYFVISVCALLGTAPVTAAHFNEVSLAGILANAVAIPLLGSAAVILGLLAAGFVFLHSSVAMLLVLCAGVVTRLGIWSVESIATFPYSTLQTVTPNLFELGVLYGLVACFFFRSTVRHFSSPFRYLPHLLLSVLLIDIVGWSWQRHFDQELRVTFLDVGQGDAAVVELPGSQVMVIDGGGFASEDFDSGEALIAPFLWSRKIGRVDILVLSHPQLDHYGGFAYLAEHFSPRELWFNGDHTHSARFSHLQTTLRHHNVRSRILCREMPSTVLGGVKIQILHPPCQHAGLDANNASLVLRLSHGTVDILFTGDVEAEGEAVLLSTQHVLASEIVKVPHHGSQTSSTPAFVQIIAPHVAVASLGFQNRFRFPAPEVIQRYQKQGSQFLRTDEGGSITIVSDGHGYRVVPFLSTREISQETKLQVSRPE